MLHPAWIAALIVLALNDHLLKGAGLLPAAVTGKLSDLAGLFVAPALLAALVRCRSPRSWWLSAAGVTTVFSALKLSSAAAQTWTVAFAAVGIPFRIWTDPTDLLALPAIALSWWVLRRAMTSRPAARRPLSRVWLAPALAGAALCAASSPWPAAAPTVNAHHVFVEHHAGGVFALDTTSGTLRARIPTEGTNVFPPAVQDGIVYWMNGKGQLAAAAIEPPQNQWIVNDGAPFGRWSDVSAVDRYRIYVFVFSDPARLVAIDRAVGTEQWRFSVDQMRYPVVSVTGDTVLFANGHRLSALNARTGEQQWVFDAADDLGRPVTVGDRIYVADDGGLLHELDLAEGAEQWSNRLPGQACATYFPIAVDGSTAYLCADGDLHAIDLSTRRSRWSRDCRGAAIVRDVVVCVDGDDLLGFDKATGATRWKTDVGDSIWTAPVAGDGMVFVRDPVSKLYAAHADSGALAWTLDMDEGRVTKAAPRAEPTSPRW